MWRCHYSFTHSKAETALFEINVCHKKFQAWDVTYQTINCHICTMWHVQHAVKSVPGSTRHKQVSVTILPNLCNISHFLRCCADVLKGPWHSCPTMCGFQQKLEVAALLCRYRHEKQAVKEYFSASPRSRRLRNPSITGDCHFAMAHVT